MPDQEILQFKMNRKGFGLKEEIKDELNQDYHSPIIEDIKNNGYSKTVGDLTFHLAQEFGFCYGVDRAVELAYETRRRYPEKKIYLTTEIIHNPLVNNNLTKMGIKFLSGPYQDAEFKDVTRDDVVLVPAFGTTVQLLSKLMDIGCELVDTICASVIVVWKRVEKYAQNGFTVLVHGKHYHEETQATTSRVSVFAQGKYLIVFNDREASFVCDYIEHGGDRQKFVKKFKGCMSPSFNPDKDLQKIGLANQTTMLSSESLHIAGMVKEALIRRYGKAKLNDHFMSFDTICNATQDRQNAIKALAEKRPDLIIVIGGYNSSNTNHLCKMAAKIAPSYHIDRAECLLSDKAIRHKPCGASAEIETLNWMKSGPLSIGITAGASTPNQIMGDSIEKVLSFRGCHDGL